MNPKKKALLDWESAKSDYEHMNRDSWNELYPGWRTTVKFHFLMGWIAGLSNDTQTKNGILSSGAKGDNARMTNDPFMHGFGMGFLSSFEDEVDVVDVDSEEVSSRFLPQSQPDSLDQ